MLPCSIVLIVNFSRRRRIHRRPFVLKCPTTKQMRCPVNAYKCLDYYHWTIVVIVKFLQVEIRLTAQFRILARMESIICRARALPERFSSSGFEERLHTGRAPGEGEGVRRCTETGSGRLQYGATFCGAPGRNGWPCSRLLIERARITGMTVIPCPGVNAATRAVVALVQQKSRGRDNSVEAVAWRHPLIDRLVLEPELSALAPPVRLYRAGTRQPELFRIGTAAEPSTSGRGPLRYHLGRVVRGGHRDPGVPHPAQVGTGGCRLCRPSTLSCCRSTS